VHRTRPEALPRGAGNRRQAVATTFLLLMVACTASGQPPTRRLTTIEAIYEFSGYFHQQNVTLRGQFAERGAELVLRSESLDLRLFNPAQATRGAVEVRGVLIDVGRFERGDFRLGAYAERFTGQEWPRPGTELVLNITDVSDAPLAATPSVRALALEPRKFEGQKVSVLGNFRGRNLFGDLPEAPGKSQHDFVLAGTDGAIWVTGLRPRGRGFDLDVNRRFDSGRWLQVSGTAGMHRGLATIAATDITLGTAPATTEAPALPPAPPVLTPAEVVFSAPTPEETDVPVSTTVRIQFSRGIQVPTLADRLRVSYVGVSGRPPQFKTDYDPATRALQVAFAAPLEPYRTVKVELLDGALAFDGAPVKPWTVTFTTGNR
jgi:hypothetical protein